jgi:hypothetical protein
MSMGMSSQRGQCLDTSRQGIQGQVLIDRIKLLPDKNPRLFPDFRGLFFEFL